MTSFRILLFSTSFSLILPSLALFAVRQDVIAPLNQSLQGRVFAGYPLASPCFCNLTSNDCKNVEAGYIDEEFRTSVPGGYTNPQWETCQSTGEQCLLNANDLQDLSPLALPCSMGSVPSYFVDVQSAADVQAAFKFSKSNRVPIIVKNTGHDFKGRSSAPNSLALWTHNLKNITYDRQFVPEGCSDPPTMANSTTAVTMGAGVQWHEAFDFAEANQITLVGGSDRTVGASGGWLQGGGHSMLSNTMGLGVDRALQFKVVTPDGQYLTANRCQNQDLFFALRGGGGGTFGVVLESTVLASPQITLQMVLVSFSNIDPEALTKELWTIMAANSVRWANEGWGGIATSQIAIYVNPKIGRDEAVQSMTPLIEFANRIKRATGNSSAVMKEFESWGAFFEWFSGIYVASVGINLALSSRLIGKENFGTSEAQAKLVDSLLQAKRITPRVLIMMSTPYSYAQAPDRPLDTTSVTDAWKNSLYHVTVVDPWKWNSTVEEKRISYEKVGESIGYLRRITRDGAYLNEADVYEPNHEESFWGSNYQRLLEIKMRYDPDHLLDCWQCVGWEPSSDRFRCYL